MATGGCLCGRVRFRILELPDQHSDDYSCNHCHCNSCRRASGALFLTATAIQYDKFRFIWPDNFKETSYSVPPPDFKSYESSHGRHWGGCRTCVGALTYWDDQDSYHIVVMLGSLDDLNSLDIKITGQWNCNNMLPGVTVGPDNVQMYPEMPDIE